MRIPFVLLFAATLLTSPLAHAGSDPCKGIKSHADKFGVTTRGTIVNLDVGGYTKLALIEENGVATLQAMTVQRGGSDTPLPAGHPAKFALGGGVLELTSREASEAVLNATDSTVFTQWLLKFDVDAATMSRLAGAAVEAVQFEVLGNKHELPVKKAAGKKILATAACLAATPPAPKD